VTGILILLLLLPSFIMSAEFTDPFILPKNFYFYFLAAIFLFVQAIYFFFRKYRTTLEIGWLDLAVMAFYGYQAFRLFTTPESNSEADSFLILTISVIIYFVVKEWFRIKVNYNLPDNNLTTGIILIGLVQAIYGLFQLAGKLPTLQTQFGISGSYGNPGPYANFLILAIPFALSIILFHEKQNKKMIWLAGISLLLMVAVLPFTKARAAWLAFFAGLIYMVSMRYRIDTFFIKWFKSIWSKIILLSGIIAMIVLISIYLFKYKEESASGRLFIWKVTLQMIGESPAFGSGFDSYAATHNNYQAKYFENHPHAFREAELADGINYAFNEFLQITSETGITGLVLFLSILFFVFFNPGNLPDSAKEKSRFLIAAKASVIMIMVTSLFSYPLRTLPVYTFFFIMLAIISSRYSPSLWKIGLTTKTRRYLCLMGAIILIVFVKQQKVKFNASREWLSAYRLVREKRHDEARKVYASLYPTLNYNQYFLFNYGAESSIMGDFAKSIDLLTEAEKKLNDSDLYIYLGNSYEGSGMLADAVRCFEKASCIMPVKFYPKYRLVKVYMALGENDNALNMAKQILGMNVKIPSDIVTGIRTEMEQLVVQLDNVR
jgi:O-antigen ligase